MIGPVPDFSVLTKRIRFSVPCLRCVFVAFLVLNVIHLHPLFANAGDEADHEKWTAEGKRIYTTDVISQDLPKIDGVLDDECWLNDGYWSGAFKQFIPEEGAAPSQKTQFKILYDNHNVYVAIRAFDNEPDKIDQQMGRRDNFAGDIVGVCFDSYFDHRTGFEFDLTASGSKLDLILLNDSWDTNWDAVWYGKVSLEDSAWTAEMQIPLSQLRYGQKEVQTWGLHVWRWINRNQEEDQWNLMPRDNPGNLYSIGEMHGIKGITNSRKIELMPYALGKVRTYQKQPGNPFADGSDLDYSVGLDGKLGISSDFTVDFTLNPDFGQVEVDPAELNISAFETFYEEKRPFFLEGKNIMDFEFGNDLLFYSRRIGHSPMCLPDLAEDEYMQRVDNTSIIGAVKLTGKTKNGLSLGVLESITAQESTDIRSEYDGRTEVVEPLTNYFVARAQQDINQSNTMVGGMITATNRRLNHSYLQCLNEGALTGGLDFLHHWKEKTFYLDVKMVFSDVIGSRLAMTDLQQAAAHYFQRPDASHLSLDTTNNQLTGYGGSIKVGKGSNGKWRYSTGLNFRSPGLDLNDLGYLQIADVVNQDISVGYVETEPKSIFRNFSLFTSLDNNWNFGGEYLSARLMMSFKSSFRNKWNFSGSLMRQGSELDTRLLRGGPTTRIMGHWHNRYILETDQSKRLSLRLGYHFHIFDDRISKTGDVMPGFTYRITDALHFSTDLDLLNRKENLFYVCKEEVNDQNQYILGTLDRKTMGLTLRLDYAVTPEFTIQYYGNPYVSRGHYYDFKRIDDARSWQYESMYHMYSNDEVTYDQYENIYCIDEGQTGEMEMTFENPDFNFRQFRSNFVARWEYLPGSTIYFVWTHGRSEYENNSDVSIGNGLSSLFNVSAENVFLLKLNYWFAL